MYIYIYTPVQLCRSPNMCRRATPIWPTKSRCPLIKREKNVLPTYQAGNNRGVGPNNVNKSRDHACMHACMHA